MLIVTGTIGVDTIHAPTGTAEGVMGGSAAYFAAAASHLAPTRLVGLVGEDWPQEHRDVLQSFDGIDFDVLTEKKYRGGRMNGGLPTFTSAVATRELDAFRVERRLRSGACIVEGLGRWR